MGLGITQRAEVQEALEQLQRLIWRGNEEHLFHAQLSYLTVEHRATVQIALVMSELAEAIEELRDGNDPNEVRYREDGKPEGFGVEIADAIIRLMDLAECAGVDLAAQLLEKHEFNQGRPMLHGRQF